MKHFKIWIIGLLFIAPLALSSQEVPTMYWVHEDHVKPSMIMEYEKSAKELVENCKKTQRSGSGLDYDLYRRSSLSLRLSDKIYVGY